MTKPKQTPAEPSLGVGSAHTFRQGSSLVTVVTDGSISVPEAVVTAGADPIAREAIMGRLPKSALGVLAEANIPVIRTGSDVIVFDVGGGGRYQLTEGRFVGTLNDAGIAASARAEAPRPKARSTMRASPRMSRVMLKTEAPLPKRAHHFEAFDRCVGRLERLEASNRPDQRLVTLFIDGG